MGSQVILWVLLALPVLSISLIVERWLWFRKRRVDVHGLGKKLNELLRRGDLASAIAVCKEAAPSLEGEVMGEALELYPEGHDAVAEMVAGGLRERKQRLQAGLLFLGTLGNNAPFVGLFGTILGIITAFRELSNASQGSMGNVMSGIAEALIATAVGILVAIRGGGLQRLPEAKRGRGGEPGGALQLRVRAHEGRSHGAHQRLRRALPRGLRWLKATARGADGLAMREGDRAHWGTSVRPAPGGFR